MMARDWRFARSARLLFLSLALLVAVCADTTSAPVTEPVFVIDVGGQQFRVRVTDPASIADFEERRREAEAGIVAGPLRAGDGGFNAPWSWHLDPATVHVADVSIGLCGGTPAAVEADLEYWLNQVGDFCPAGARVIGQTP